MASGNPISTASDTAPVFSNLDRLGAGIGRLNEIAERLEARLAPDLAAIERKPEPEGPRLALGSSVVAERLSDLVGGSFAIGDRLERLIDRLEA